MLISVSMSICIGSFVVCCDFLFLSLMFFVFSVVKPVFGHFYNAYILTPLPTSLFYVNQQLIQTLLIAFHCIKIRDEVTFLFILISQCAPCGHSFSLIPWSGTWMLTGYRRMTRLWIVVPITYLKNFSLRPIKFLTYNLNTIALTILTYISVALYSINGYISYKIQFKILFCWIIVVYFSQKFTLSQLATTAKITNDLLTVLCPTISYPLRIIQPFNVETR